MNNKLEILSYFSIPVDLAKELGHWKEFVSGSGYDTIWMDAETGEKATTRFLEKKETEEDFVVIESANPADLMFRVSGAVINLLSSQSDYVMVYGRKVEPGRAHNVGYRGASDDTSTEQS